MSTQSALSQDIHLLGDLLGQIIQTHEGKETFETVETIRTLSKETDDPESWNRLLKTLQTLSAEQLLCVSRAFSHFLNYANIAEQHHNNRLLRHQSSDDLKNPALATLADVVPKLVKQGVTAEQLLETLSNLKIELVLTAHPTEVTRRTLLKKYLDIQSILAQLDRSDLPPSERNGEMDRLRRRIIAAWQTDEIRHQNPTPIDEAKWGFATVENSLWKAVPESLRSLDAQLLQHTGKRLPIEINPIRVASWMGGDRDGNPNVTAEVTKEVLLLSRWQAADLILRDLHQLRQDLSMQRCSDALRERVGNETKEPYRALLRDIRNRVKSSRQWTEAQLENRPFAAPTYTHAQQLLEPLYLIYHSLVESQMEEIAQGTLLNLIRCIQCFGVILLPLDIRQHSGRHADAIDAICAAIGITNDQNKSYLSWSEEEKQAFLLAELENPRPLIPQDFSASDEVTEVLNTFALLSEQPSEYLGAYIISMARQPSDVLAVKLLQKACGCKAPQRIVPLFETLEDLQVASNTLDALLNVNSYRSSINDRQEIMIGYSDSTKSAGFLGAAWAQYQAQEQLLEVANQHSVKLTLFHGRGGSVSRGGGSARDALISQPVGCLNNGVRVTEQGEVIRYKYGEPNVALFNLELYLGALLEGTLSPSSPPKTAWRETMDRLSTYSVEKYRKFVYNNQAFIDYFKQATPEAELQRMSLGSRPAKRKPSEKIDALRAIPWVFAWTQMRLMLPAWLGVGEALQRELRDGRAETFSTMLNEWPYFKMLLDMQQMVLAKSDAEIAKHYELQLSNNDTLSSLGELFQKSLRETIVSVEKILGHSLLEHYPKLSEAIKHRNPYLKPLHLIQIEVMKRLREPAGSTDAVQSNHSTLELALKVSIAGIAAGLRNTG